MAARRIHERHNKKPHPSCDWCWHQVGDEVAAVVAEWYWCRTDSKNKSVLVLTCVFLRTTGGGESCQQPTTLIDSIMFKEALFFLIAACGIHNLCIAAKIPKTQRIAFISGRGSRSSSSRTEKINSYGRYCGRFPYSSTTDSLLATHATQDKATAPEVWTLEQLEEHALNEGVQLSISTLGPGFRTVARSSSNSSAILGYCEGFVRPSGEILHLDKMEIFKKMVQQVKAENPEFRGGGSTFGVGLLFGYQALLHGKRFLWLRSYCYNFGL